MAPRNEVVSLRRYPVQIGVKGHQNESETNAVSGGTCGESCSQRERFTLCAPNPVMKNTCHHSGLWPHENPPCEELSIANLTHTLLGALSMLKSRWGPGKLQGWPQKHQQQPELPCCAILKANPCRKKIASKRTSDTLHKKTLWMDKIHIARVGRWSALFRIHPSELPTAELRGFSPSTITVGPKKQQGGGFRGGGG